MNQAIKLVVVLLVTLGGAGCSLLWPNHGSDDPALSLAKGFKPLFNGTDLDGWKASKGPEAWSASDGMIVCDPTAGPKDGYLYTEDTFGDFVLTLEYKVTHKGSNSGVFFRVANPNSAPATGFEVQVLGDYGDPPSKHTAGAVYGTIAPPKNVSKPIGQWNTFTIIVQDRFITTIMNGERLYMMNMDDPKINAEVTRPDLRPKDRKHNTGHIALQNHGNWVAYRNIQIKELD